MEVEAPGIFHYTNARIKKTFGGPCWIRTSPLQIMSLRHYLYAKGPQGRTFTYALKTLRIITRLSKPN